MRSYRYDPSIFDLYNRLPEHRLRYPDENVIRFLYGNVPHSERTGKVLLDVGCGAGRHLVLGAELGFSCVGVDGSEVALQEARHRLADRSMTADLRNSLCWALSLPDASVDVVVEHATLVNNLFEDVLRIMAEVRRVLRTGGVGFFLLKRKEDCAFDGAVEVDPGGYVSMPSTFLSEGSGSFDHPLYFRAFSEGDVARMYAGFSVVNVYRWDLDFKSLSLNEPPGVRRTAYWIVTVRK